MFGCISILYIYILDHVYSQTCSSYLLCFPMHPQFFCLCYGERPSPHMDHGNFYWLYKVLFADNNIWCKYSFLKIIHIWFKPARSLTNVKAFTPCQQTTKLNLPVVVFLIHNTRECFAPGLYNPLLCCRKRGISSLVVTA